MFYGIATISVNTDVFFFQVARAPATRMESVTAEIIYRGILSLCRAAQPFCGRNRIASVAHRQRGMHIPRRSNHGRIIGSPLRFIRYLPTSITSTQPIGAGS